MPQVPLDLREHPDGCECEFTPFEDGDPEESYHYLRQCPHCQHKWYSLHCPHESARRCPECKELVPRLEEL